MSWPLKRFGDMYVVPSRNGITRPSADRGIGYKMINMGELFAYPRLLDPAMERVKLNEDEKEKFNVLPLDLLFARQSLVAEGAGKCCIALKVDELTTFESHLIRVRLDQTQCNPNFYYYFFSSKTGFGAIQTLVNQVSAAGIRGSDLAKLKVLYPPPEIQKKAAAVLSAHDELIENNQRRIALQERMAEAIYREWFVRLRFPGHEKMKLENRPLREFISGYIGGDWGEDVQNTRFRNRVYVIRGTDIENVMQGEISTVPVRYIKDSALKSRKLKAGDLVMENSVNHKSRTSGKSLLITQHVLDLFDGDVICASFCKLIRPKDARHSKFLWLNFRLLFEQGLFDYYQNIATNGIANLQAERLMDRHLIPFHEGIDMSIFDRLDTSLLARTQAKLRGGRDNLLPRLISGKLSVENLDIQFPPSMAEDVHA